MDHHQRPEHQTRLDFGSSIIKKRSKLKCYNKLHNNPCKILAVKFETTQCVAELLAGVNHLCALFESKIKWLIVMTVSLQSHIEPSCQLAKMLKHTMRTYNKRQRTYQTIINSWTHENMRNHIMRRRVVSWGQPPTCFAWIQNQMTNCHDGIATNTPCAELPTCKNARTHDKNIQQTTQNIPNNYKCVTT